MTLSYCTVSGNAAAQDAGGILNGATVNSKNCLIANNACTNLGTDNVVGLNLSYGYDPGFTWVSSDPLNLGPLAGNGSVAIVAATDGTDWYGSPLRTDQRGSSRPSGAAYDVGAFEVRPNQAPTAILQSPRVNEDTSLALSLPRSTTRRSRSTTRPRCPRTSHCLRFGRC